MRSDLRPIAAAALLPLLAACGGERGASNEGAPRTPREALLRSACRGGDARTLELAVAEYVKGTKPKPQRFLTAAGTDSALPDAGVRVLQDKGPLYYFPADPAQQARVRADLRDKGDYTTLLVVPRAATVEGYRATVRLGGHFVGGQEDGRAAGDRSYGFSCDTTGWRMTNAASDQQA